jgi:hypothetical protein
MGRFNGGFKGSWPSFRFNGEKLGFQNLGPRGESVLPVGEYRKNLIAFFWRNYGEKSGPNFVPGSEKRGTKIVARVFCRINLPRNSSVSTTMRSKIANKHIRPIVSEDSITSH